MELTTLLSSAYLTLAVIAIIIMLLALAGLTKTRVPFVPVSKELVPIIIQKLELKKHSVFYDLGCGDGRVIVAAGKIDPTIIAIGVEKAPLPYLLSKCALLFSKQKNTKVLFRDFMELDFQNASHIFLYLLPETIKELLPKLEKELKQGTKVILCDFPFKNKEPIEKVMSEKTLRRHVLYIYNF